MDYGERVSWATVKADNDYVDSDDNNGLTFGLYYIDFEGEGDILDVEWFASDELRDAHIKEHNIKVVLDE